MGYIPHINANGLDYMYERLVGPLHFYHSHHGQWTNTFTNWQKSLNLNHVSCCKSIRECGSYNGLENVALTRHKQYPARVFATLGSEQKSDQGPLLPLSTSFLHDNCISTCFMPTGFTQCLYGNIMAIWSMEHCTFKTTFFKAISYLHFGFPFSMWLQKGC